MKPRSENATIPPRVERYPFPQIRILGDLIPNTDGIQRQPSSAVEITDTNVEESVPMSSTDLEKSPLPPLQSPSSHVIVVKEGKVAYQPKVQITRTGRVTRIPAKFRD